MVFRSPQEGFKRFQKQSGSEELLSIKILLALVILSSLVKRLGAILDDFLHLLGLYWPLYGLLGAFGHSWAALGRSFGLSWGPLEAIGGGLGGVFGRSWSPLGRTWHDPKKSSNT